MTRLWMLSIHPAFLFEHPLGLRFPLANNAEAVTRLENFCNHFETLGFARCSRNSSDRLFFESGAFGLVAFADLQIPIPDFIVYHSCPAYAGLTNMWQGCTEFDQKHPRTLEVVIKTFPPRYKKLLVVERLRMREIGPKIILRTIRRFSRASPYAYDIVHHGTFHPISGILFQQRIRGSTVDQIFNMMAAKYRIVVKSLVARERTPEEIRRLITKLQRAFRDFLQLIDLLLYVIEKALWDNHVVHCDLHLKNIMLHEQFGPQESTWNAVRQGFVFLPEQYVMEKGVVGPFYRLAPSRIKFIDLARALNFDKCPAIDHARLCLKCNKNSQLEDAPMFIKALTAKHLSYSERPSLLLSEIQGQFVDQEHLIRDVIEHHNSVFITLIQGLKSFETHTCMRGIQLWKSETVKEALQFYNQPGMNCTIPAQKSIFRSVRRIIAERLPPLLMGDKIQFKLQPLEIWAEIGTSPS